ncbi:hypothetical protein [Halovivax cerinus]|uniref:DUF7979 domain-containing protein n=1 Tax=Halovivax cerinus TaxID=1487865 RepID=A0ABD5NKD7_9EURY|nr:hypothetical protein [Halovivax cerinus]
MNVDTGPGWDSGSVCTASIAVCVLLVLAGCSVPYGIGPSPSDDPSDCTLHHDLVEEADNYADPIETYQYDTMSSEARHVFVETREQGSYTTSNSSRNSQEFRYGDETSVYNVTYENEEYTLVTYTSEGCEFE